jgi:hypothetical protein
MFQERQAANYMYKKEQTDMEYNCSLNEKRNHVSYTELPLQLLYGNKKEKEGNMNLDCRYHIIIGMITIIM